MFLFLEKDGLLTQVSEIVNSCLKYFCFVIYVEGQQLSIQLILAGKLHVPLGFSSVWPSSEERLGGTGHLSHRLCCIGKDEFE